MCNAHEADPQKFTVILTVNLRSTSIGAGLRAIRPEATFRDLSTPIDSSNHRDTIADTVGAASASVRATTKKGWHRTP
jgi:hypothetical protein